MNSPLTPEFERTAAELDEVRKIDSRQPVLNRAIFVALGVVLAAIAVITVRSETRASALREAAAAQDQAIARIQQDMKGVCRATPTGSLAPADKDACARAEQAAPPTGKDGSPGRPPTADEIQAAVEGYFLAHPLPPGQQPTSGQVSVAVADYLVAHPVEPGRAPTAEEISAAVASYFERNPVRNGEPGRAPTAEEIATAVRSYCAPPDQPSPCRGADGAPGPPCPAGYELRDVVADAPDGGTYTRAKTCVDPASSQPPSPTPTTIPLLPIPPS